MLVESETIKKIKKMMIGEKKSSKSDGKVEKVHHSCATRTIRHKK
jgi:hypothetical protein